MQVSSFAGVPGAIPGAGVPGGAFFPGKGVHAALQRASPCFQGWGRCLGGGPQGPLNQHGGLGTYQPGSGDVGTPCLATQPWVAWGQEWVAVPGLPWGSLAPGLAPTRWPPEVLTGHNLSPGF